MTLPSETDRLDDSVLTVGDDSIVRADTAGLVVERVEEGVGSRVRGGDSPQAAKQR